MAKYSRRVFKEGDKIVFKTSNVNAYRHSLFLDGEITRRELNYCHRFKGEITERRLKSLRRLFDKKENLYRELRFYGKIINIEEGRCADKFYDKITNNEGGNYADGRPYRLIYCLFSNGRKMMVFLKNDSLLTLKWGRNGSASEPDKDLRKANLLERLVKRFEPC